MKEETYEIYYDKEMDFLEIFFGEPSECIATEVDKGIFVRKDNKTDEIKSISIIDFGKRMHVLRKILQESDKTLPYEIDISNK